MTLITHHQRTLKGSAIRSAAAVALITGLLNGCNFDLGPLTDDGRLLSISLGGPSQVQVGDTITLTAMGSVSGLIGIFFYDRILDGKFSISDPATASIIPFYPPPGDSTSFTGVKVVGRKPGSVVVAVTARRVTGIHSVEVIAAGSQ